MSAWNAHFRNLFHTKTIYANKCYVYEICRLFYRNRLLKSVAVRHYAHIIVANLSIKIHNAKKISEKKRLFFIFSLIMQVSACFYHNFRVILYSANKKRNTHRMRTVIQRVSHASVTIDGTVKSSIGHGFLLLLGVEEEDTTEDVDWLVKKVAALRVFDDENGVMNRSILDTGGEALVVSQFTLYASYKKGNRPSWFRAARHEISVPLYEDFCRKLSDALGKPVGTGEFGADMKVELLNDGPVTICMDTKNKE